MGAVTTLCHKLPNPPDNLPLTYIKRGQHVQKVLRQFEHIVERLLVAQPGRSGIDRDLAVALAILKGESPERTAQENIAESLPLRGTF